LIKQRFWRWEEIAELRVNKTSVFGIWFDDARGKSTERDVIEVYDPKGKVLVTLTSELADFEVLTVQIRMRSTTARGRSTYDEDAEAQRKEARQRRSSRMLGVGGVNLFFGVGFIRDYDI
jgi:hypothetical protein